MARTPVTLIPGDGIGPEVVAAAVRVLSATGIDFDWETEPAGVSSIGEHGTPLPPRVLESVRRNKVALKGPTETPVAWGWPTPPGTRPGASIWCWGTRR